MSIFLALSSLSIFVSFSLLCHRLHRGVFSSFFLKESNMLSAHIFMFVLWNILAPFFRSRNERWRSCRGKGWNQVFLFVWFKFYKLVSRLCSLSHCQGNQKKMFRFNVLRICSKKDYYAVSLCQKLNCHIFKNLVMMACEEFMPTHIL